MAVVTDPIPEGQLVPVAVDDRTAGGIPLPHPSNSAKRDAVRTRAALILIDAALRGNAAAIESAVSDALNGLIGAAPELLNTLDEIANALGDDPNFAATVTAALGSKASKAELAEAVTALSQAIASSVNPVADRVGALETKFPSRARLIARAIAYSGVR